MMQVYGIGNCDRCRKARKWLDESGREYQWHDLRADGIDQAMIRDWIDAVGLERLVNRRSTTWRELDEADRARAMAPRQAPELLVEHPTLIKRPLFAVEGSVLVGFDESVKQTL